MYKIYSSNTKQSFEVPSVSTNTETDLVLIGSKSTKYGQHILSNFVKLLTNFANITPPDKPITGQLFFNSDDETLYVFDTDWNKIENIPNTNNIDVIHIDTPSQHSTRILTNELERYIPISGNTDLISISTTFPITDDKQAVTKKYVDDSISETGTYITKTGTNTITGPLLLANIKTENDNEQTLINKQYVDSKGVFKTSGYTYQSSDKSITYDILQYINDETYDLDGLPYIQDVFTITTFKTDILSGNNSITINLPFSYATFNVSNSTPYKYNMSVVVNSIKKFEPLRVEIINGSSFTVYRNSTESDIQINGTIMGLTSIITDLQ